MDVFGIMGFVFGMAGLSYAVIVQEKLTSLIKEFDEIKKVLQDKEILK